MSYFYQSCAIGSLKSFHFSVDKKADLKLCGSAIKIDRLPHDY